MKKILLLTFTFAMCNILLAQKAIKGDLINALLNDDFEYSMPIESEDGQVLYYVRTPITSNIKYKGMGQEIWYSKKENENWTSPQLLFKTFQDQGNNALVGISENQQNYYFFNSQSSYRKLARGIAKTSKDSLGEWENFKLIDVPGLKITEGVFSFYMHPSEKILIVSMSNNENLNQDSDLYVSLKKNDGSWTPLAHLGESVNTAKFEGTPFLSSDLKTLYFSSDGHPGAQGVDIYKVVRLDESWQNWSKAERLEAPFNSKGFDAYFSLSNEKAYWVSNRQHENSQVYTSLLERNETMQLSELDSPKPKIEGKDTVATFNKMEEGIPEKKVEVDNSEEDQKLRIYFDYNHFELTQAHKKQLQEFIANWASEVKINLSGYADNVGSAKNNMKVSRLRAQAVYDYLIELSVPSKQIVLNSYGDKSRFGNNVSEEGRAKNRVVILE